MSPSSKLFHTLFSNYGLPILASILTFLSISVTGSVFLDGSILQDLSNEIHIYGLSSVIAGLSILFFYINCWDRYRTRRGPLTHSLAAIFSSFTITGISYASNDTWDFLFASIGQFAIAAVCFFGFFILFDIAVTMLFDFLDGKFDASSKNQSDQLKIIRRPFGFAFICIVIAWLPYLLLHLPGSVPYDGYRQLNMGLGYEAISQHHPWLLSIAFSLIMRVGQTVSDNFGVFLITSTLFLIEAVCYASVCRSINALKAPTWLYIVSVAFFAIVPAFGAYAQVIMKDGLYSALFALWFSKYVMLCISLNRGNGASPRNILFLTLLGLLVSLCRNNGLYIIVPAHILLIACFTKRKRVQDCRSIITISIATLAAVYFMLNNVIAPAIGVLPGPTKEMLSVPFQQTARYLRDYPDDVTESEAEAIGAILDYEHLGERYNSERSDPVKDSFDNSSTRGDLLRYFLAWASMGIRHPDAYIQATLNNVFGYFYPGYNYTELGPYQFYIQGEPIATGDLNIHYIVPENIRSLCDGWALLWRNTPVLNLFVNPATYTWVLILCVGYLIHRRRSKYLTPIVILFLNVAICCISPVNGYLRYALPLMACMPILLSWMILSGTSLMYSKKPTEHQDAYPPSVKRTIC